MSGLPAYPAAITLQWIGPPGLDFGVPPGWYPISPILPSNGHPWPETTVWPSMDAFAPLFDLEPPA
ncbi:MAG: hypothetical protein EOM91_12430 [Sphingobacteriia bacterium]|nr:hypothetical protein [Sphingobacteriia bacterium]